MRRWGGLFMALVLSLALAGCAKSPRQDGHTVMFEGAVRLYDDRVYHNGTSVGEVLSSEIGAGYVTRLRVAFTPDFIEKVGANLAVYINNGRLRADKLQGIGGDLDPQIPLCGFNSRAAFNWFKFKTLLSDRIPVAKRRALELQARME